MTDSHSVPDLDQALSSELRRLAHVSRDDRVESRSTRVVVLAGGRGRRLEPYTSVLPKPLMPIGNRSILELVVDQLAASGFRNLTFSVGYLSHLIRAVFENGAGEGVDITYVKEIEPLGTAGPLRLVTGLDETFLVMNGDLLTTLEYSALLDHHLECGNVLTIAAHRRKVQTDYGVLHLGHAGDPLRISAYEEKPEMSMNVSMGVYVLEPETLDYIPPGGPFDFPHLVQALLKAGLKVGAFVHDGLWLDIGRHEDYEQAVELWAHGTMLSSGEEVSNGASVAGGAVPAP